MWVPKMTDMRYPLAWPHGWARTQRRTKSRYAVSQNRAQDDLLNTIRLMKGRNVVISTNLELRKTDGLPKSSQRAPRDVGVAVYFVRKGKDFCIACDKFNDVRSNIRAIGKALEGLRAMELSGVTELLDRAFQGFAQLPSSIVTAAPPSFRKVLGLPDDWPVSRLPSVTAQALAAGFRKAMAKAHPDTGGSHEEAIRVTAAHEEAKKVLKEWLS